VTRLLFLIHRYLGIALSLVVVAWCVSGLVMMYFQYPSLTEEERVGGLEPLALTDCCRWPADFSNIDLQQFDVEMLAGSPVIRLTDDFGDYVLDLATGRYVYEIDLETARRIAASATQRYGLGADVTFLGAIDRDQWTISGYDRHLPLYKFAANDDRGTELYVSSTTGSLVQMTTSAERIGNWLGSVVHWFYPTVIRQHVYAWSQAIIWLSILGLFLTVVGIYIGIKQLKPRRNGRLSPYRGFALWHHYAGLVFGLLTLTWLFSGLLSMNPWGVLAARSFAGEADAVRLDTMRLEHAQEGLAGLVTAALPAGTVRLVGEFFAGRLFVTAWTGDAERTRFDAATWAPAPVDDAALAAAAARLRPRATIAEQGWLVDEDAYYFSHHDERRLPVYRVRYTDGERFYLDATTGQLSYAVDAGRRNSRWLFLALHRGDFAAFVRERPVWDIMMWLLMGGVTIGAATGAWLGVERIARALRRFAHRRTTDARVTT